MQGYTSYVASSANSEEKEGWKKGETRAVPPATGPRGKEGERVANEMRGSNVFEYRVQHRVLELREGNRVRGLDVDEVAKRGQKGQCELGIMRTSAAEQRAFTESMKRHPLATHDQ